MNLHWIDWAIVAGAMAGLLAIAFLTKSLTRSVADFLAANRLAGRYLLTMATGMAGLGAISIAANFEKFYEAGFAGVWWGQILAPLMLILALSGFVIYRYRETRALTMAQFFEMRYSRRFRIFSGLLAFLSGILNYGIFPAVSARFIIYFTGLPTRLDLGFTTIPTLAPVMAVLLGIALVLTLFSGQIAVMITDFLQGQFIQITILAIFFYLISRIGWTDLIEGLRQAPPGHSKINPFDQSGIPDFNVWFFLMMAFINVYAYKAWLGSQAYNAAPKSPHEAKMAGILGEFRGQVVFLLSMLLPAFVFAMMHLPSFANEAGHVNATLATIADPQIQKQMLVPLGLSELLPVGLMGLFVAVIIMAAVSTDDTYLLSWGSIFIQDVVMPFRKKPLSERAHMLLLRFSIIGVALFAFTFSLLFPLNEYILMYFQITGAIYLGGAGAVVLGGLYWRRGTVEGAWGAMITGSVLAITGIVARNIFWPHLLPGLRAQYADLAWIQALPEKFPFNGTQVAFGSALIAVTVYVVLSLLSRREPMDMDRLLHRGKYAVTGDHDPHVKLLVPAGAPLHPRKARTWAQALGMGPEFTRGDKWIYMAKLIWSLGFFAVFLVGTIIGSTLGISEESWITWWAIKVGLSVAVGFIATVWFLIGGFRDLADLVRGLRSIKRDDRDDGSVIPSVDAPTQPKSHS